jgi:hypothetical protein
MTGKIKPSEMLQAPYIKIKAKITMPGTTNGKPNIKYEDKYIVSPSAKKIATYITNQLFGSELLTETEGLDINWLTPSLIEALEKAIYQTESFIYIHKFHNKVYLECLNKSDIHDLVQVFDEVQEATIKQEFELGEDEYELHRHIIINGDGTSTIEYRAFREDKDKEVQISIERFNELFGTEYERIENKPYEVLVNIDTGQDFFRDSVKLLNEEMQVINTIAEEVEKTKTRIATSQHYQTGDIATTWKPRSTTYEVNTLNVGNMQDYFVLMPGDRDHAVFEFLQGDLRTEQYVDTFKFYDYQIIQMAGLSPATFGYEKDSYMNTANVDLSANASEMTIEAIKRQLTPQINRLIENIIRLQNANEIEINKIPETVSWDFGENERLDDMKKLSILQRVQQVARVPYSVRAEIITPIINKLIDTGVDPKRLIEENDKEDDKIEIEYGEI